jgi:hypothetical protein
MQRAGVQSQGTSRVVLVVASKRRQVWVIAALGALSPAGVVSAAGLLAVSCTSVAVLAGSLLATGSGLDVGLRAALTSGLAGFAAYLDG